MARVVLDDVLSNKLNGGRQGVEVLDAAGKVPGHYRTHSEYVRLIGDAAFPNGVSPAERGQALHGMTAGRLRTAEDLLAEFERIRQTPRTRP